MVYDRSRPTKRPKVIRLSRIIAVFATLVLGLGIHEQSYAQSTSALVVSTCGSQTLVAGNNRVLSQDTTGTLCAPGGGSGSPVTVTPVALTTTNGSGTIATGGTFQSILASSATRKGCLIENPTTATEPLYVFFGANGSATTSNSISLSPGGTVSCAVGGIGVATDNVSATATTTAHSYVEMSQ